MYGEMGPGYGPNLIVFIVMAIPFAIGNYYIAKALHRPVPIWVILSLIPLVNYFFFVYVVYVVILHLIGSLGQIAAALPAARADLSNPGD